MIEPERRRFEDESAAAIRIVKRIAGRSENTFVIKDRRTESGRIGPAEIGPERRLECGEQNTVESRPVPPIRGTFGISPVRPVSRHTRRDTVYREEKRLSGQFRFLVGDRKRSAEHAAPANLIPVRIVILPPVFLFDRSSNTLIPNRLEDEPAVFRCESLLTGIVTDRHGQSHLGHIQKMFGMPVIERGNSARFGLNTPRPAGITGHSVEERPGQKTVQSLPRNPQKTSSGQNPFERLPAAKIFSLPEKSHVVGGENRIGFNLPMNLVYDFIGHQKARCRVQTGKRRISVRIGQRGKRAESPGMKQRRVKKQKKNRLKNRPFH